MRLALRKLKTAIIKSTLLADVLDRTSPTDAVLARASSTGFMFFAWPGTPLHEVIEGLLILPPPMRTMHTIFARTGTIIDPVFDIERPVPPAVDPTVAHRAVLDEVLEVLDRALIDCGEAVEKRAVFHSSSSTKSSFHVHLRLKGSAATAQSMLSLAQTIKHPAVDHAIYRRNGMLRLYRNFKTDLTRPMELYDEGYQIGLDGERDSTERERCLMAMSLCVRDTKPERLIAVPMEVVAESSYSSTMVPLTVAEVVRSITEVLQRIPLQNAEEYHSWIRVAFYLKRIALGLRDEPTVVDEDVDTIIEELFVQFSRRSSTKFDERKCRRTYKTLRLTGDNSTSLRVLYRRLVGLSRPDEVVHAAP